MSVLHSYCHSLETGNTISGANDNADIQEIAALHAANLITELPTSTYAICPHCYEQLAVSGTSTSGFYIECEDGKISVPRQILRRWSAAPLKLIEYVRSTFKLTESVEGRVPQKLWYVGRMPGKGSGFPIWFLKGADCPHIRSECGDTLQKRSPGERGVVITTSRQALFETWPKNTKTVLLEDLLQMKKGELTLSSEPIWSHAPPKKQPKKKRGAPSKNHLEPLTIFNDRIIAGSAIDNVTDEAKAIANYEAAIVGEHMARKWQTIRNTISGPHRDWKFANNSCSK